MSRFVLLVCGGRNYRDRRLIYSILDQIHEVETITKIVQGWADGADRLADAWAQSRGVKSTRTKYQITPTMWREQGKAAGYIRNNTMLVRERPDIVLGFHGGNGTANMLDIAKRAFVPRIRVNSKGSILDE